MSAKKGLLRNLLRAARGQTHSIDVQSHAKTSHVLLIKQYPPLPCFALHNHHFGRIGNSHGDKGSDVTPSVPTPSEFHAHLCKKIRCAKDRVILASLYIGVGSDAKASDKLSRVNNCKEDELLHALNIAASNPNVGKIQILLDANRAFREVSYTTKKSAQSHSTGYGDKKTYSAKAVYAEILPFLTKRDDNCSGVFLFPVNNFQLCSILPSPLGEVAGVFHIKAYIIDNELILSGANLSEEYFTNRLDRYTSFVNGGAGLVDFYADLCDILCNYSFRYDGNRHDHTDITALFSSSNDDSKKKELEASLIELFNAQKYDEDNNIKADIGNTTKPVAYAIPTFQMPVSFLGKPLQFHSDAQITRNLLQSALDHDSSVSVRLSSAYLNLTPVLQSILANFGIQKTEELDNKTISSKDKRASGFAYILTAGTLSHGFAPKKGTSNQQSTGIVSKIKDAIPEAFLSLVKQVAEPIIQRGGKILMYERAGWTFHAKGLWITVDEPETTGSPMQRALIQNPSSLVSTVIGSGNYGARSEDLDVESNLVIVFNDADSSIEKRSSFLLKKSLTEEWNDMCKHSNELAMPGHAERARSKISEVAAVFFKRFL